MNPKTSNLLRKTGRRLVGRRTDVHVAEPAAFGRDHREYGRGCFRSNRRAHRSVRWRSTVHTVSKSRAKDLSRNSQTQSIDRGV